jgi:hypothetical protein
MPPCPACLVPRPRRYRTSSTNTTFQIAPFFTDKDSADTVCKNNGGSLASYVSQQEQSEVEQVGATAAGAGGAGWQVSCWCRERPAHVPAS